MKNRSNLFACLFMLLMIGACNDDSGNNPMPPGEDLDTPGTSLLQVESVINQLEYMQREAVLNLDGYLAGENFFSCATVYRIESDAGDRVKIVFNASSTCQDTYMRSGTLILDINRATPSFIIHPENYSVNGRSIEGTFLWESTSEAAMSLRKVIALNGKLRNPDGSFIQFSADRTVVWKAGEDTPQILEDDIFESTEGIYHLDVSNYGKATYTITSPLTFQWHCFFKNDYLPVKGQVNQNSASGQISTTNFGDGSCNGKPTTE